MAQPSRSRRMIAPIVITVVLALYYLAFALVCLLLPEIPLVVRLIFGLIPLAVVGVLVYVLIERIKEIRSGEEDDLSQY